MSIRTDSLRWTFALASVVFLSSVPRAQTSPPPAAQSSGSAPACIYCPPPEYTNKARKDKVQGTVTLQVTITPEGRATNISVTRSLRMDLDTQAVKAVVKWRFKPATDPNGKTVPLTCPIEVTFRLY